MLRSLFSSIYPESDDKLACSRKATTYLRRGIFVMGIRKPQGNFYLIYILWSFALNLCSTFYQPIAFQISYFTNLDQLSTAQFLTSIQVAFNALACSMKVVIVWVLSHRLDRALDVLDELDQTLTQKSQHRIIHKAVARSNFQYLMYFLTYMNYVSISFLGALISGRPAYQNYYPMLDWRASRTQYFIQSALEFFAMAGAAFQNVCVDSYPLNYMFMLRAHMSIFKERLRQLGADPNESMEQRYEALIKCIQDHKTILRLCDALRPVISGTIFVQFCAVGLVLGLTLINIVMFADLSTSIGTLILMIAVLMETTPFCVLCNYLVNDCNELADALFESNWIDAEQRYKKTLMYFLHVLQQPIIFKAMNIFAISVGTNLTVTRFAFSVFTLLKQMNIAERFADVNKP